MTTALILIDVQNAILAGKASTERQPLIDAALDQTVARLVRVLEKARRAGVPVIIVQHDGGHGHRLETGTAGWELRPEIAPVKEDILVRKSFSDSFFATDLNAQLIRLGAERLVIGGCMTQYCVDTTVRRAVSIGYDVTLLSDGHATGDTDCLGFDEIVSHHNDILAGFDAGPRSVTLASCADVGFQT